MAETAPILLVEDNLDDITLALRAFAKSRFANPIVIAYDGVDALDYLHGRGAHAGRSPGLPAAVLLDIHMPRLNGMEVLRAIKSEARLSGIPVVMLTAAHQTPEIACSAALGASGYMVKPIGPAGFLEVMKSIGMCWTVATQPAEAACLAN